MRIELVVVLTLAVDSVGPDLGQPGKSKPQPKAGKLIRPRRDVSRHASFNRAVTFNSKSKPYNQVTPIPVSGE